MNLDLDLDLNLDLDAELSQPPKAPLPAEPPAAPLDPLNALGDNGPSLQFTVANESNGATATASVPQATPATTAAPPAAAAQVAGNEKNTGEKKLTKAINSATAATSPPAAAKNDKDQPATRSRNVVKGKPVAKDLDDADQDDEEIDLLDDDTGDDDADEAPVKGKASRGKPTNAKAKTKPRSRRDADDEDDDDGSRPPVKRKGATAGDKKSAGKKGKAPAKSGGNTGLLIAGVVAVVVLLGGGVAYVMSSGRGSTGTSPNAVTQAPNNSPPSGMSMPAGSPAQNSTPVANSAPTGSATATGSGASTAVAANSAPAAAPVNLPPRNEFPVKGTIDFRLFPADAETLVHVRLADLWDSALLAKQLDNPLVMNFVKMAYLQSGLKPRDIESITVSVGMGSFTEEELVALQTAAPPASPRMAGGSGQASNSDMMAMQKKMMEQSQPKPNSSPPAGMMIPGMPGASGGPPSGAPKNDKPKVELVKHEFPEAVRMKASAVIKLTRSITAEDISKKFPLRKQSYGDKTIHEGDINIEPEKPSLRPAFFFVNDTTVFASVHPVLVQGAIDRTKTAQKNKATHPLGFLSTKHEIAVAFAPLDLEKFRTTLPPIQLPESASESQQESQKLVTAITAGGFNLNVNGGLKLQFNLGFNNEEQAALAEKLTTDDLKQAAETLKSNPAKLPKVLKDLAQMALDSAAASHSNQLFRADFSLPETANAKLEKLPTVLMAYAATMSGGVPGLPFAPLGGMFPGGLPLGGGDGEEMAAAPSMNDDADEMAAEASPPVVETEFEPKTADKLPYGSTLVAVVRRANFADVKGEQPLEIELRLKTKSDLGIIAYGLPAMKAAKGPGDRELKPFVPGPTELEAANSKRFISVPGAYFLEPPPTSEELAPQGNGQNGAARPRSNNRGGAGGNGGDEDGPAGNGQNGRGGQGGAGRNNPQQRPGSGQSATPPGGMQGMPGNGGKNGNGQSTPGTMPPSGMPNGGMSGGAGPTGPGMGGNGGPSDEELDEELRPGPRTKKDDDDKKSKDKEKDQTPGSGKDKDKEKGSGRKSGSSDDGEGAGLGAATYTIGKFWMKAPDPDASTITNLTGTFSLKMFPIKSKEPVAQAMTITEVPAKAKNLRDVVLQRMGFKAKFERAKDGQPEGMVVSVGPNFGMSRVQVIDADGYPIEDAVVTDIGTGSAQMQRITFPKGDGKIVPDFGIRATFYGKVNNVTVSFRFEDLPSPANTTAIEESAMTEQ